MRVDEMKDVDVVDARKVASWVERRKEREEVGAGVRLCVRERESEGRVRGKQDAATRQPVTRYQAVMVDGRRAAPNPNSERKKHGVRV